MTLHDILTTIANGQLDNHLDTLQHAIKARRDYLAASTAAILKPGDTVTIQNTRPKYLIGQHATVEKLNHSTVSVRFNDPMAARRFGSGTVRVPITCVTRT